MAMEGKCRGEKGVLGGLKSMVILVFIMGKCVGKISSNYVCVGGENKQIEAHLLQAFMEA